MIDLSQNTVLITGGAGAIGAVVAEKLAAAGAKVFVNDIVDSPQFPHGNITYIKADITQGADIQRLFDEMDSKGRLPDTVCCHAGMSAPGAIETYTPDDYDRLMALNLKAAFFVSQEACNRWITSGMKGHLIFTSSWVESVPWPGITPYASSKAAMKATMRGFAREMAPKGIRANAVSPGIVGVGMAKKQWDEDPSYRARAARAIPLGDLQTPDSVADAFLFLVSPLARYMTGTTLTVDGGCSLYPMD